MNLKTFMTLYVNKQKNGGVDDFVAERINKQYVPLEEKDRRAQIIVDNTYFIKDKDGNDVLKVNSTAKHMFTFLTLVDMYTDIEISFRDALDQYNELRESGAMDDIYENLPQKDLSEFKIILNMKCDDLMINEYEPHSYVTRQVERFADLIGTVVGPIIEGLDVDKIVAAIESFKDGGAE